MRDEKIFQMQQANATRSALILRQFMFLKTRQEAFEKVLTGSTFRERLRWSADPAVLLKSVDGMQKRLLAIEQAKFDEAAAEAQKPKIEVVKDPGIVGALKRG